MILYLQGHLRVKIRIWEIVFESKISFCQFQTLKFNIAITNGHRIFARNLEQCAKVHLKYFETKHRKLHLF